MMLDSCEKIMDSSRSCEMMVDSFEMMVYSS